MSDSTVWVTISSGFSLGLSFLLNLALLLVALVIVRKRCATAAWLMSGAAAVKLLTSVASPIAYAGVGHFAGTDEYMKVHAVLSVSFSLVHAAGWALLLVGIGKLAGAGGIPTNRSALTPP
jgi:hypothetical protein